MASGLLDNLSLIFIVEIVLVIFLLLVIVLTMFQVVFVYYYISAEAYYNTILVLLPHLEVGSRLLGAEQQAMHPG